jgi:Tat protein secretion system quality control protein TatD with DNase activity
VLAELKGYSEQEIIEQTSLNSESVFNLSTRNA